MPPLNLVLEPGEVGFQNAQHCYRIGGGELARLAVTALTELDDAEIAEANLSRIGSY